MHGGVTVWLSATHLAHVIGLFNYFAKAFESILHKLLLSTVKSFISVYQHGFIKNRSNITNLASFSQYVSEVLNASGQVTLIFTRLSTNLISISFQLN